MPIALPWLLGALGIGAAGGYIAGVKTRDVALIGLAAAGLYYLGKR